MASFISEVFIIENDNQSKVQFYLNSTNEIFVSEEEDDSNFFFTINKEDWNALKDFIDEKLSAVADNA